MFLISLPSLFSVRLFLSLLTLLFLLLSFVPPYLISPKIATCLSWLGGGVRNFEYWLGEKYVFVTVWCSYVYIIQHVYMLLYLFRDWEALFLFSFITNLQVVLLFFLFCNSILNIIRYSISLFLFFFFLILVLLNNMVHISCVPQIFFSLECSWKWC